MGVSKNVDVPSLTEALSSPVASSAKVSTPALLQLSCPMQGSMSDKEHQALFILFSPLAPLSQVLEVPEAATEALIGLWATFPEDQRGHFKQVSAIHQILFHTSDPLPFHLGQRRSRYPDGQYDESCVCDIILH